jgi:hypothetical protein
MFQHYWCRKGGGRVAEKIRVSESVVGFPSYVLQQVLAFPRMDDAEEHFVFCFRCSA